MAMKLCLLPIFALGSSAAPQRLFSIGDLHGDYERFTMILERLGLATVHGGQTLWTGGNSILVSTGDTVDRGEHGRKIFLAFQELAKQAPGHGGEVVNILGNHELLNLQGDLRYVHPEEFQPQNDYGGSQQRSRDWSLGGTIGQDLRSRYLAAAVRKGILFVHAGLHPRVLKEYGDGPGALDDLNRKVTALLNASAVGEHPLFGEEGPFWDRSFAWGDEAQACENADETLRLLGADRMVVGHTAQMQGVNARCYGPNGPRIILGDTLISRAYGSHGRASAIEYNGNETHAIYFPDDAEKTTRRVLLKKGVHSEESSVLALL